MGSLRLHYIAVLLVIFCGAVTATKRAQTRSCTIGKYNRIFVIGDSFVDNGNRDPDNSTYTAIGSVNQSWQPPFGRTRPGKPAGRFSDGKVLSDFLADYMGLKPVPYRSREDPPPSTRLKDGINFAVGGAGVFPNEGFTKTGDQIRQLKAVMTRSIYRNRYDESLVFYTISGNDYAAYVRNGGSLDPVSISTFVTSVVGQATKDLRALYDLGFRSFVVSKLSPLGCGPASTAANGFKECQIEINALSRLHNVQLALSLTTALPFDANVLYLDNQLAFEAIIFKPFDNARLDPCCSGLQFGRLCGDVDGQGNKQYSLCNLSSQADFFWWDEFHPTETAWSSIFNLFTNGVVYTSGRSLRRFLGCS
ncbi:GDSL esterase/lipase At3g09930 [Physcomitrium patens]|uniref:Uncharacterized protein n=1 Tax=Physcomitrium patens TaxID=3218 RepID=A0A2K1JUI5_PHYPA|nr:GDSL esterase/lipase At3g09930-like [Physcomitrium patens]PNR45177.1 hypothetical protein PHYPA_014948 [Physcomitrium patens]|eukprot:XP_024388397.1 GDSL esterase/lipase At3g09930-like [Physcomitrella patens]